MGEVFITYEKYNIECVLWGSGQEATRVMILIASIA